MTTYPRYPERKVHNLDGIWKFTLLKEGTDPEKVNPLTVVFDDNLTVPSAFDAFPAYAGKRGTCVYSTSVDVTPGTAGVLRFEGMGMWARVFVDGKSVFTYQLPYSAVDVQVAPSDSLQRRIDVVINNEFNLDLTPLQEQYMDFYAYGGIFRPVRWLELPKNPLSRCRITPVDVEKGQFTAEVKGAGEGITFLLDGSPVVPESTEVKGDTLTAAFAVKGLTSWSCADPNLHTLTVKSGTDILVERFGLRVVTTGNGKVYLNGKETMLLGYCRHEAHPQFGPALPESQMLQDIQLLKQTGCNFIRGSHYPQDQRFLDLCDETGMLVWEEGIGWGQQVRHFENETFCDKQEEQLHLMVNNSYNHPSVIMWGYLNEGESHKPESTPLYRRLTAALKSEDSSRPVTYATNHPFDDLNLDQVDIISVNKYPGWYPEDMELAAPLAEIKPLIRDLIKRIDDLGMQDKPFIISEMGAGAIYGWRDPLRAHWSEEYQADHVQTVCEEVVENPRIAGVSLWQFCDMRTYASGYALKRPRAFNNKGSWDEYRRPKMVVERVKDIFLKNKSAG